MTRCLRLFPALLASAALFVLTGTTSSTAAEFELQYYHEGSQFAEVEIVFEGTSRDTFFFVNVFPQLLSFANLDASRTKTYANSDEQELLKDRDAYNLYQSFAQSINEAIYTSGRSSWTLANVRALGPELDQFKIATQYNYDYYMATKQFIPLREARLRSEKMMCAFFSAAFTTTIMDRNGGEWLFSDEFDDEDEEALDRAIALEFEAAYHVTRFYGLVHHASLLPLFDRFYERCVGYKRSEFIDRLAPHTHHISQLKPTSGLEIHERPQHFVAIAPFTRPHAHLDPKTRR